MNSYQGSVIGDQKKDVKVKIVAMEKKYLLLRELEALNLFKNSRFFVNLMHDQLLSSADFIQPAQSALRFDNHIAMVMEKGVVTLDRYLAMHGSELAMGDYMQIIGSAFNIVKEAHSKKLVLLDLKGSNIMLFDSGIGMRVWKGIDLDGYLPVDSPLGESSFMATVPFMAPELLDAIQLTGLRANQSMDIWSLGILTFNIFVAKQSCDFWKSMGMNSDTEIREGVRNGRLTQENVDENINRNFPGHVNSTQRRLLHKMLKVNPSERYTIAALCTADFITGVASYSASRLYDNQQHIIGELKSLRSELDQRVAAIVLRIEECIPDNLAEQLATLERSTRAADKKAANELREKQIIERSPPTVQYYVTVQVAMNGVFNACTSIKSEMVGNERKGLAGSIASAIETFSSLANSIPFAKFGLDILTGALNKWDERQQKQAVARVVDIFLGDSTVSSLVAEGVARKLALFRQSKLEEADAKSRQKQQQMKGQAFAKLKEVMQHAVDFCLDRDETNSAKSMADADCQVILQAVMDGSLTINAGITSTAPEKAEAITANIVAYIQSKKF